MDKPHLHFLPQKIKAAAILAAVQVMMSTKDHQKTVAGRLISLGSQNCVYLLKSISI
jgi:hypothetical protein